MTTHSLAAAEAWAAGVIERAGVDAAAARSVARALVAAEADGLSGHGLGRLPTYVAMVEHRKIDGRAKATLTRPRPGTAVIDAAHGFAYPALDLACEALPALAVENGIAFAAIHRSNHAGAAGLHVERLAERGLVALLFANTPAAMAPWGGKTAVFGTNPIAFAAPVPGAPPVVVDMALSKVARGAVVAAKQKGQPIPAGWALDAAGQPTTDATAALAGTMVAMGDAKGAALALMVEILGAVLVGAVLSKDASSFLDAEGSPPDTGQCIIAIDPSAASADYATSMTRLVAAIEAEPGARLPGQRRLALRAAARRNGLAIPDALIVRFGAPA